MKKIKYFVLIIILFPAIVKALNCAYEFHLDNFFGTNKQYLCTLLLDGDPRLSKDSRGLAQPQSIKLFQCGDESNYSPSDLKSNLFYYSYAADLSNNTTPTGCRDIYVGYIPGERIIKIYDDIWQLRMGGGFAVRSKNNQVNDEENHIACKYDVYDRDTTSNSVTLYFEKLENGNYILSATMLMNGSGNSKIGDDASLDFFNKQYSSCPNSLEINRIDLDFGIFNINILKNLKTSECSSSSKYCLRLEPSTSIELSNKYEDIQSCKDTTYKYIKQCGCMPASLTDLTSRIYMLIKIAAPALLLIVGGFDLVKAMSAQDDSAIKKAQQKLVKKFVAAAAVFLILTLVQFLVSTLSNNATDTLKCLDYLLNGYVA